jgi:hypothetical protein
VSVALRHGDCAVRKVCARLRTAHILYIMRKSAATARRGEAAKAR